MFPEFFHKSSRILLSSALLTGEFAKYARNCYFCALFHFFHFIEIFFNFSGQNFVTGTNHSRILQDFRTEFRFQKQQTLPKV